MDYERYLQAYDPCVPQQSRWQGLRYDIYCPTVHVLFEDREFVFTIVALTDGSRHELLAGIYKGFCHHSKTTALRWKYVHFTRLDNGMDHYRIQKYRLCFDMVTGCEKVQRLTPLCVTPNGDPICPDLDMYPDFWNKSTTSVQCTGPIRMRLAMCVGAADRFIALLQEYKDDENVINAIDQYNNTWLHHLCCGRSMCGRGYDKFKDEWLKMTKAFIAAVDISWMLEHKNVMGNTPMKLARQCGKEMEALLLG